MAEWSTSSRACKALWTTLRGMSQLNTNFENSGALRIKDLTFYNPLNSSDLIEQDAKMVADQIDNVFRNGRGAIYEEGVHGARAMIDMVEVLADGEKQVMDLALVADDLYRFFAE